MKVLMSRLTDEGSKALAGTVLAGGLKIATGNGVLELLRVQREGKSAQEVSQILTAEIEAKYYCDNDNGKGE